MSFVVFATHHASENDCAGPGIRARLSTGSRFPTTQMDDTVRAVGKFRVELPEALPRKPAIGKKQVHAFQGAAGNRAESFPDFDAMQEQYDLRRPRTEERQQPKHPDMPEADERCLPLFGKRFPYKA